VNCHHSVFRFSYCLFGKAEQRNNGEPHFWSLPKKRKSLEANAVSAPSRLFH